MSKEAVCALLGAGAAAALLAACGSSSSTAPSGGGGGGGGTNTATITISNNTVSPSTVTVVQGTQVTFVNNDSRSHEMNSNPHPEHTQCPEINQVGFLSPGQSRQTGNMITVMTCGFHDHSAPDTRSLQGSIVITAR